MIGATWHMGRPVGVFCQLAHLSCVCAPIEAMPNYICRQFTKYRHNTPKQSQHCQYEPARVQYGRKSQKKAVEAWVNYVYIKQLAASHYLCVVEMTILHVFNSISADSSKSTLQAILTNTIAINKTIQIKQRQIKVFSVKQLIGNYLNNMFQRRILFGKSRRTTLPNIIKIYNNVQI